MDINENEIKKVSSLEPFKRYNYFLKKIADSEKIYTLGNDEGEWALSTVKEYSLYPLWSASEFALKCCIDGWSKFRVMEVPLEHFIDVTLVKIVEENLLLNVFPVGNTTGFVVNPKEFLRDIKEELENYE
ncbi:MAG: DUF2750 domain-containing protein [Sphingobacteriaceae bacterium]|nr:DUF2750 domain-containing protein [Sphingobacteriaceae bacterium]